MAATSIRHRVRVDGYHAGGEEHGAEATRTTTSARPAAKAAAQGWATRSGVRAVAAAARNDAFTSASDLRFRRRTPCVVVREGFGIQAFEGIRL